MENNTKRFAAKVIGNPSKEMMKTGADGSQRPYVLQQIEITEGPLANTPHKELAGTVTLVNRDGKTSQPFEIGTEVVAWITVLPSNVEGKKYQIIADLSAKISDTDHDEVASLLGF